MTQRTPEKDVSVRVPYDVVANHGIQIIHPVAVITVTVGDLRDVLDGTLAFCGRHRESEESNG